MRIVFQYFDCSMNLNSTGSVSTSCVALELEYLGINDSFEANSKYNFENEYKIVKICIASV